MQKHLFVLGLACLLGASAAAQSRLGSWNILNLRADLTDRWSLFAEGQVRSLRFYNHFHYWEAKGGATYKVDKNFAVTAGFGRYMTFSEGGNFKEPAQTREYRSWAQVNAKNSVGRVGIEHRYRAEQRFTNRGFRNRFRYRLQVTIPLGPKDAERPLALQPSNEVFLTNQAPFFERNRSALNLSYGVSKHLTLQSGILHQYDYRLTDETGRTFFQIAALLTIDLKKDRHTLSSGVED